MNQQKANSGVAISVHGNFTHFEKDDYHYYNTWGKKMLHSSWKVTLKWFVTFLLDLPGNQVKFDIESIFKSLCITVEPLIYDPPHES